MPMMLLVTNESSGKALKQSSLVLDMFLNRVAPRCWHGNMSSEGYKQLLGEVKAVANKNTCVQFFWLHVHDCRLVDVVGRDPQRGKAWSPVGMELKKPEIRFYQPHEQLAKNIGMLAALLHDTGKAKTDTQQVYRGADRSIETLYHEVASAYWLNDHLNTCHSTDSLILSKGTQAKWSKVGAWPKDTLKRITFQSVVSHHGLPAPAMNVKGIAKGEGFSLNRIRGNTVEGDFELIAKHADGSDVLPDRWHQAIQRILDQEIKDCDLALLNKTSDLTGWQIKATAEEYFYFIHRLLLMVGDASESAFESSDSLQKKKHKGRILYQDTAIKPLEEGIVYAKSARNVRLDRHLLGAADFARKAAYLIYLRESPRVQKKPAIYNKMPQKGSPFYWQNAVCTQLKSFENEQSEGFSLAERGFFGVVTSNTGVGKTQGCYLIMSALSNHKPRYTLGLGFGVLAVQSGVEYRTEIGLSEKDVGIAVGSKFQEYLAQQLAGADKSKDEVGYSASSRLEEIAEFEAAIDGGFEASHLTDIHSLLLKGRKGLGGKLLDTPIIAMTIDHIAAAMNPNRGSFIAAMLRVATSDLLIDEIDSFSPKDLHGIARLIYLTGLFGRKVVISSATVPVELAEGLLSLYMKGYRAYQLASGAGDFCIGLFNDAESAGYASIKLGESFSERKTFSDHYTAFHSKIEATSSRKPAILEPAFLNQSAKPSSWSTLSQAVLSECVQMANNNHEVLGGYKLSVGVVRVARVKHAQTLAQNLAELIRLKGTDGWTVKLQVLHGRLCSEVRSVVQEKLALIVGKAARKDPSLLWSRFSKNHANVLNEADQDSKKILIILVATSVVEVGVDYDFDWALTEPSTKSASIQLAGRVLRHRWAYKEGASHFKIMPYTLLEMLDKAIKFKRYGGNIATGGIMPISDDVLLDLAAKKLNAISILIGDSALTETDPVSQLETLPTLEAFMGSEKSIAITNTLRLSPATKVVDQVERKKLQAVFGNNPSKVMQLGHFLNEVSPFSTNQYLIDFRDSSSGEPCIVTVIRTDKGLECKFHSLGGYGPVELMDMDDVLLFSESNLPDLRESHELLLMISSDTQLSYYYHSAIGFLAIK